MQLASVPCGERFKRLSDGQTATTIEKRWGYGSCRVEFDGDDLLLI